MKAIVRAVVLVALAVLLPQCTGTGGGGIAGMQGCPQIAQKSSGPCRVGLGPSSYKDDAWRQQ